jgi:hypothetical protein
MNNFIIAFIVPPMLHGITWGTYIFFSVFIAMGGVFIYFLVPETKGRTLEEMDAAFGSYTSHEDMNELARVQEEVGLTALVEGREHNSEMGHKDEGDLEVKHIDV